MDMTPDGIRREFSVFDDRCEVDYGMHNVKGFLGIPSIAIIPIHFG
jgi:hypothetical protein